jgi:hypothetical protein
MRRNSGESSLSTLLFLLVIAAGIYAAVMFVPPYVDNLNMREAVAVAHNLAARNPDTVLRNVIRERTRDMGTHFEPDGMGSVRAVAGLGLSDEQILIERNPVTQSVRIEVLYEKVVQLKPTQRTRTLRFNVVREGIPPQ